MNTVESGFVLVEFNQGSLPGIASVNLSLQDYDAKEKYPWHLSLLLQYRDREANQLPAVAEQDVLYQFEENLRRRLAVGSNGMFLARVTHGGIRELVWRVRNAKAVNALLGEIIASAENPRPMDYRIDPDPKWDKTEWFFRSAQ